MNQGRTKNAYRRIMLLMVLLFLDAVFVVLPAGALSPPYCSSTFTVLGGAYMSYSTPRGVAIHDGSSVRWVWDEEANPSPWPDNWDFPLANAPVLPRTQARGFLTPSRIVWHHRIGLVVSEALGGAATEAKLRREFADRLANDPVIGPRMPKWYWQKLATVDGVTSTWNYALVLHDILFVAALGMFGWQLLTLGRIGLQRLRGRDPGVCPKCHYDLSGLTADRCPECGAPINDERS